MAIHNEPAFTCDVNHKEAIMIHALSYKTISQQSDLFLGQFRLRHQEFIERQRYQVRTLDGMEFDEYDTLASVYLVYSDNGKTVQGVSRLTPTDMGCMLADHWPELVDDKSLIAGAPDIWEGTRFCIDKNLDAKLRRHICDSLACAYVEYALTHGIAKIIGLMPTMILRSVFEKSGIELDRLGEAQQIGAHAKIQAASIRIGEFQLDRIEAKTGLRNVLGLTQNGRDVLYAA
jgi:N-acyl-L-homoserine lactone synthetase